MSAVLIGRSGVKGREKAMLSPGQAAFPLLLICNSFTFVKIVHYVSL